MMLRLLTQGCSAVLHNTSLIRTTAACSNTLLSTSLQGNGFAQPADVTARCFSSVEASTSASESSTHRPDLVQQYFARHNESHRNQFKEHKQEVIKEFQQHSNDRGSAPVTVAIWTHYIREQTKHFDKAPKHLHAMRHCEILVNKRRRLLAWLRRTDFQAYSTCIFKLGLADVFGQQMIADRYRVGIPHDVEDKNEDTRRRRFAFHSRYRMKKTSMWKRLRPQLMYEDPMLPAPPSAVTAGAVGPRSTGLE